MDMFWAAFGGGAAGSVFTLLSVVLVEWVRGRSDRGKGFRKKIDSETVQKLEVIWDRVEAVNVTVPGGMSLKGERIAEELADAGFVAAQEPLHSDPWKHYR